MQQTPAPAPGKVLSIIGMILGILAVLNSWYGGGIILGGVGIVLSILAKKKMEEAEAPVTTIAKVGLILSIAGAGISVFVGLGCIIACVACPGACATCAPGFMEELLNELGI